MAMRHTASFLQTFHTAQTQAQRTAASQTATPTDTMDTDPAALAFVKTGVIGAVKANRPVEGDVVEIRGHKVRLGAGFVSEAQAKWMIDICETREVAGAESVFVRLEQGFAKFPGSQFITANKNAPRKVVAKPVAPVAVTAEVPDGRYAVEIDGELKFYHLSTGKAGTRWDGFKFLDRKSSDDLWPIKSRETKAAILAAIAAAGPEAAEIRYAVTLKSCRSCHRDLTDQKNPYLSIGLGPDCGAKA
jgi:hypothetical protein